MIKHPFTMITKILTPRNFLFLSSLITSTIIIITSSNWIILWLRIEVNIISIIPLILITTKNKELEGAIKYFLVQTVGSISILLAIFIFNTLPIDVARSIMIVIRIIIKIGVAPFHIWLPQVINNIMWLICFLIVTWQKLGPIIITSYILTSWSMQILIIVSIINGVVGSLGGVSQTQMRPLIAYSSIAHIGWIIRAIILSSTLILFYFIIYFIVSRIIIFPLIKEEKKNSINFNSSNQIFSKLRHILNLNLLSIGGMPPLLGFIPKWIVIRSLILYSPILTIRLILTSILRLFFYLKVIISNFINVNKSFESKIKINIFTSITTQITLPFWFIIIILCNK